MLPLQNPFNRVPRRLWRLFVRLAIVALLAPLVLQWMVAYIVHQDARLLPAELQGAKSFLIVTAHPDDECLFFAPSILGLLDNVDGGPKPRGSLLVMSTGNNYGLGDVRKRELLGSCHSLGIDASRCVALDHPQLQDNPTVWWDTDLIQSLVVDHVKKWAVDAIITFDAGGVSGHINHRAVSAAVRQYASTNAQAPPAYMLTTTSLLRKYTFLGDLPLTALPFSWRILEALFVPSSSLTSGSTFSNRALAANSWRRYLKTRQAFASHDTQYSWDRHLYLVLSRYAWFNDLSRVPPPPAGTAAD